MFDFMGKKWWFFAFSTLVVLPGLIFISFYGLRFGIDFTGGALLEYEFEKQIDRNQLEKTLKENQIDISSVISSGAEAFIIKTKPLDEEKITQIKNKLSEEFGKVEVIREENVGPVIGQETTRNALLALGLACLMIIVYIAFAFRNVPKPASSWRFGITAVAALLHDILVVVGLFAAFGYFFKVEVDVLFITALLTIIGFSVHDTIVVFDRIRELLPKHLSKKFTEVANVAILQTLTRSLNTSLTVVLVLVALLLFGGETIKWFTVTLLIGIISGTYSSIFNATALLVLWEERLGH